jgi:hypothetical protein
MELGRQPAPAASEPLICRMRDPLFASAWLGRRRVPLACWWARAVELSTLTSQTTSPIASERVCACASTRSRVPSRRQPVQPVSAGLPRTVAVGQIAPGRTSAQLPQDTIDHRAMIAPLAATPTHRQQWRDEPPSFLRQLAASDHVTTLFPSAFSTKVAHLVLSVGSIRRFYPSGQHYASGTACNPCTASLY